MQIQRTGFSQSVNRNNSQITAMSFSGRSLKAKFLENPMFMIEHKMGSVDLRVAIIDLTKVEADAYVVPQFQDEASYQGVGGAIARMGAKKGIDVFAEFLENHGKQEFGTAVITPSGGGNSKKLVHVVSVGGLENKHGEFNVVHTSVANTLKAAQKDGIKSVVFPALGTGIIGSLTAEQSAKAMLSAIDNFAKDGGYMDVVLAIHPKNLPDYSEVSRVLNLGSYKDPKMEIGQRQFSQKRYQDQVAMDTILNMHFLD